MGTLLPRHQAVCTSRGSDSWRWYNIKSKWWSSEVCVCCDALMVYFSNTAPTDLLDLQVNYNINWFYLFCLFYSLVLLPTLSSCFRVFLVLLSFIFAHQHKRFPPYSLSYPIPLLRSSQYSSHDEHYWPFPESIGKHAFCNLVTPLYI